LTEKDTRASEDCCRCIFKAWKSNIFKKMIRIRRWIGYILRHVDH